MAVLEKVMQLKQQGATEPQIIDFLRQEGVSPREIDEALSQSKIKSMIDTEQEEIPQPEEPSGIFQPQMQSQITPMQPNMIPVNYQQQEDYQQPGINQQQFQQQPMQQIPSQIQQPLVYEQRSEQYAPQEYYEEYAPQQTSDIETINDIAEQIVEEKNAELKKQISAFSEFKDSLSLEVEKINERIARMENIFNELQIAILKKIGDYGENIQNIEKEMHMTQNSFSKILNPLTDNIREMQKMTGLNTPAKPSPKTKQELNKKEKPGFEDYLR
jgi:DNA-binding transcriptional MerR regulator